MDPMAYPPEESFLTYEGTKRIQIGDFPSDITYLGVNLDPEEEVEIVSILKHNLDLFAWKPSDMLDIEPSILCHNLALDPSKSGNYWRLSSSKKSNTPHGSITWSW